MRSPRSGRKSPLHGIEIDGEVWTIIEEAQPYKTSDPRAHLLGLLAMLSNRDKHRTLAVHMAFPANAVRDLVAWDHDAVLVETKAAAVGPLSKEHRTELLRLRFDPSGADPQVHVQNALAVNPTFGDERRQFSVSGLGQMLGYVGELVGQFRRFF